MKRKKIIKIRAEVHEIENRKIIESTKLEVDYLK